MDRGLAYSTIRKDRIIIERQLSAFCQSRGLRYLEELEVDQIADFRSSWKNSANTGSRNWKECEPFFGFAALENGSKKIRPKGFPGPS